MALENIEKYLEKADRQGDVISLGEQYRELGEFDTDSLTPAQKTKLFNKIITTKFKKKFTDSCAIEDKTSPEYAFAYCEHIGIERLTELIRKGVDLDHIERKLQLQFVTSWLEKPVNRGLYMDALMHDPVVDAISQIKMQLKVTHATKPEREMMKVKQGAMAQIGNLVKYSNSTDEVDRQPRVSIIQLNNQDMKKMNFGVPPKLEKDVVPALEHKSTERSREAPLIFPSDVSSD